MAFTEKNLIRQAIPSTAGTLYTVPSGTTTIVKDIHICNNGSTDCYVSLWFVPNGGTTSNSNVIFKQWSIPSNDFAHWNGYQILHTAGDTIRAQSQTANQITITISGAEVT